MRRTNGNGATRYNKSMLCCWFMLGLARFLARCNLLTASFDKCGIDFVKKIGTCRLRNNKEHLDFTQRDSQSDH